MTGSNDAGIRINEPSLPKGGGSIKGMGESITAPGSDGMGGLPYRFR